jgi:hypothetical protein
MHDDVTADARYLLIWYVLIGCWCVILVCVNNYIKWRLTSHLYIVRDDSDKENNTYFLVSFLLQILAWLYISLSSGAFAWGAAYQRWVCIAGAAPAACACGNASAANFSCDALWHHNLVHSLSSFTSTSTSHRFWYYLHAQPRAIGHNLTELHSMFFLEIKNCNVEDQLFSQKCFST